MARRLRQHRARTRQRSSGESGNRQANEASGMHHGSLAPGFQGRKLRSISNANPTGGIKACDNAAFGLEPQGYGMAHRLAYGLPTADKANAPQNAPSMAVSWPPL